MFGRVSGSLALSTAFWLLGFLAVVPALAQQQVVLKNGATMVGQVTFAGENLEIDIDGSTLSIPLNEIDVVSPLNLKTENLAKRLLMRSLESIAMEEDDDNPVGLLAEAFRLAPEDPSVAMWYARALVQSGDGGAAHDVFQSRREQIAKVYPRMAERISGLIEERLELELLPTRLVEKIDRLRSHRNSEIGLEDESDTFAAYFQLVDQHQRPVDKSAFRIDTSGDKKNLESFHDGYHLYVFSRRRNYGSSPCRLQVSQPGLSAKNFEFTASRHGVADAGKFQVRRFEEKDRLKTSLQVLNIDNQPIKGVRLQLRPKSNVGSSTNVGTQVTNEQGVTSFLLYPGEYYSSATAEGFLPVRSNLSVKAGSTGKPTKIKMHRLVKAKVKVAWHSVAMSHPGARPRNGGESSTGEIELSTMQGVHQRREPSWVNLQQKQDEMHLQIQQMNYGYASGMPLNLWIGVLKQDAANDAADAEKKFAEIDLEKLDSLDDELIDDKQTNLLSSNPLEYSIQRREQRILVGRTLTRDPRTGQPQLTEFRALIEKIESE